MGGIALGGVDRDLIDAASRADAVVGEANEFVATEDSLEPLYAAEESVERAILRAAEWQARSALSGAVGALCGLAAYLLLVRSRTTKGGALAGLLILLIPAFAWWMSPAVSMLSAWHGTLSLRWAISTPGIVVPTTLVTAGLVVRIVKAGREPIEGRRGTRTGCPKDSRGTVGILLSCDRLAVDTSFTLRNVRAREVTRRHGVEATLTRR